MRIIHVLGVLTLAGSTALASARPVVVDGGAIEGVTEPGLTVYRGIPFAAPPTGAQRWREPQPAKPWIGVRRADAFAPACMQTGVSMPGEPPPRTSEDCLYLNVWVSDHRPDERLPVLIWIHGGGYTNGATSMPLYAGDRLARKGLIVVTVAYRLGPFGFLAHPELTKESARHGAGNYGLMDQIAALRWVQRNVAAFGGDPGRVTIAGQSAGAMSVSLLMASPSAAGLFHRAIAQSGGVFEPTQIAPHYALANAERTGVEYATSVGARSLAELRTLPAAALLGGKAGAVGHPVIEPAVLPESPYEAYVEQHQRAVPIMIGWNADEARSLVDLSKVKAASFAQDIAQAWGALPPPVIAAYPFTSDDQARKARAALERDLRFGWDMWTWARLQVAAGGKVWLYRFTQAPPFPAGSVRAGWGASHFAELWYMFGHLDQEPWTWRAADRRLSSAMVGYWASFVRSGDPNDAGLPRWPVFTGGSAHVLQLGDPITAGGVPELPTLQVFDAIYAQVRGAPVPGR